MKHVRNWRHSKANTRSAVNQLVGLPSPLVGEGLLPGTAIWAVKVVGILHDQEHASVFVSMKQGFAFPLP